MYRAKVFPSPNLARLLEARFEHAHALQLSVCTKLCALIVCLVLLLWKIFNLHAMS
jgi:hypothetical protein